MYVAFKLVLRWAHLLDHDSGHRVPPGVSLSRFLPHTVPNIDSHTDYSLANPLAEAFNLSCFVYVVVCSPAVLKDVVNAIDGEWSATFHTVEGEVPALTTIQATADPEIADEFDFQGCVIFALCENTLLKITTNRNSQ